MEQSPSWEANRFAASSEIPPRFVEPEGSLPHSQVPATSPYHEPARSSPVQSIQFIHPHPTSWRSILILSSHLCLGLPSGLFPPGFPTKTLYTPLLSPHTRYIYLILYIFMYVLLIYIIYLYMYIYSFLLIKFELSHLKFSCNVIPTSSFVIL